MSWSDKLIASVADILNKEMKNAFRVYRIGGDEFVILYFDKKDEIVKKEMEEAMHQCMAIHIDDAIPVGASFGFAKLMEKEDFSEMIHRADISMYQEKEKFYQHHKILREND